jgi:hypothetical protein
VLGVEMGRTRRRVVAYNISCDLDRRIALASATQTSTVPAAVATRVRGDERVAHPPACFARTTLGLGQLPKERCPVAAGSRWSCPPGSSRTWAPSRLPTGNCRSTARTAFWGCAHVAAGGHGITASASR